MQHQHLRSDLPGRLQSADVCQHYLATPGPASPASRAGRSRCPGQAFDLVVHEVTRIPAVPAIPPPSPASSPARTGRGVPPVCDQLPGPGHHRGGERYGQCGAVVNYEAALSSGSCGVLTTSPHRARSSRSAAPASRAPRPQVRAAAGPSRERRGAAHRDRALSVSVFAAGAVSCGALVPDAVLGTATASDNCAGVTITRSGVPAGNVFPVGTTIVTYTATDASGNTSSAAQSVTVVDNAPPSIVAPPP